MDDVGIAFYFLDKLKNTNHTDAVPAWVIWHLQRGYAANQQRVAEMSRRFSALNQGFENTGIRCAVLKGYSLVPQFCPDASLRHQGDLDYLVDDQSMAAARQVVIAAGYEPKGQLSNQEITFLTPGAAKASRTLEQYSAQAPHAVELHTDVWDSELNRLPLLQRQISVERTTTHHWNGLSFPALGDEDAFLVQVLHTCRHLFTYWIRLSNLFEIGYFLNQRAHDMAFWGRIAERVGKSQVLKELVVVVAELVEKLFAPTLPPLVRAWGREIRPATRVWIENYARPCALCELPVYQFSLFPRSKLVLFLHQQYQDTCAQKHVVGNQLMASSRLSRLVAAVKDDPWLLLNPAWWKRQLLIRRTVFHAMAGLRYVCEIPRWMWLTRASARPASVGAR
jgi:hypothetical protein